MPTISGAPETISGECIIAEGDYDKFGVDTDSGSLSEAISTTIEDTVGTAPESVVRGSIEVCLHDDRAMRDR